MKSCYEMSEGEYRQNGKLERKILKENQIELGKNTNKIIEVETKTNETSKQKGKPLLQSQFLFYCAC